MNMLNNMLVLPIFNMILLKNRWIRIPLIFIIVSFTLTSIFFNFVTKMESLLTGSTIFF